MELHKCGPYMQLHAAHALYGTLTADISFYNIDSSICKHAQYNKRMPFHIKLMYTMYVIKAKLSLSSYIT